jgi:hypothetical protein
MRGLKLALIGVGFIGVLCGRVLAQSQVLTLDEAARAAENNNRSIRVAELEQKKALDEVSAARTYRLPIFSLTALGFQPLSRLGLTLDKGSLGTYPSAGPIHGRTTTLESPLRVAGIFYANVAQPRSQQHKIGLGVQLASVGVKAADEQIRSERLPLSIRFAGFTTQYCKQKAEKKAYRRPTAPDEGSRRPHPAI